MWSWLTDCVTSKVHRGEASVSWWSEFTVGSDSLMALRNNVGIREPGLRVSPLPCRDGVAGRETLGPRQTLESLSPTCVLNLTTPHSYYHRFKDLCHARTIYCNDIFLNDSPCLSVQPSLINVACRISHVWILYLHLPALSPILPVL